MLWCLYALVLVCFALNLRFLVGAKVLLRESFVSCCITATLPPYIFPLIRKDKKKLITFPCI